MAEIGEEKIHCNPAMQRRFREIIASGHLAHAYLFIGPAGVGKFDTALSIAKMVNCESYFKSLEKECRCSGCAKIDHGNHPDVRIIQSAFGETIKIDDIRTITQQVQYRPFEADKKVFIIQNVDNLTLEGGNALLKTLEEPSNDSLIILTSSVPEKILQTVRSRCQMIMFYPYEIKQLTAKLHKQHGLDRDSAQFVASFAEGSIGKAENYLAEAIISRKNEIIEHFVFLEYDETFVKELLADKEASKLALDILLTWFRDLWLLKLGIHEDQVVHRDRLTELYTEKNRYTLEDLDQVISEIVKTVRLLKDNLNVKVALTIVREKIWTRR